MFCLPALLIEMFQVQEAIRQGKDGFDSDNFLKKDRATYQEDAYERTKSLVENIRTQVFVPMM